ncbi:MAG: ABC transporter ATP-binding protein [Syntrophothermus sp.]
MNDSAISVQNLQKSFGENQAVQGISFEVAQGEIFSLLGPNGAGKTTTISMLSCLLRPDAGDARVMGHSIRTDDMGVKSVLGVVPQELALYEDLTARENLTFWGKMYGLRGSALKSRVSEVLDVIGLSDRSNERVGKYSGGMKRRVNIGVALLHRPKVIYMDEPTVGIDPQSRRNILDSVVALKDQGMTVLYTTHYMEEAQELSDHIAIVDHGRLIACGTNEELVKLVGEQTRIDLTVNVDPNRIAEAWRTIPGAEHVTVEDERITVLVDDSNVVLPRLFDSAAHLSTRITSVDIREPNLEAVFLHLTGRALRD